MSMHRDYKYQGETRYNPQNTYSDSSEHEYYSMTNELRIANLEKRLDNAERMIMYYEEMMHLKEDEKRNDYKIEQHRIIELDNKVTLLEDGLKSIYKKLSDFNQYLNEKLENIDKRLQKHSETKNTVSDFYSVKLAEMESMLNKNNL